MSYLLISTLSNHFCMLPPYLEEAAPEYLYCERCFEIWEEIEAVDVIVCERNCLDPKTPLTFLDPAMLPVVHASFLECFHPELIRRDLYLGRVYNEDEETGKHIFQPEWHTVRGRHRLVVRGTKGASLRRCEVCRRPVYDCGGGFFLYPAPPEDVAYFTAGPDLVVRAEHVDVERLRGMENVLVEEIPVADTALDGYGVLDMSQYVPPPDPHWQVYLDL